MSDDDDDENLTNYKGTARLFPLPNLVLFPGVVQGLHIFEPRYRQMVADALTSDSLIAIVLLKPGWEDEYDNSPAIEEVACLGRIGWHEKLADGRYNLRIRGLTRIQIHKEISTNYLYRVARVEAIEQAAPTDIGELKQLRHELAEAVLPRFADDGQARQQLQELFAGEMSLGQVCDLLSYALPLPTELKQALLAEPHAGRRAVTITDTLRVSAARADRKFPPDFSHN
jgi:uncharacterized protein